MANGDTSSGVAERMQKLYCSLEETGQDTQGRLLVVAAVMTDEARDTGSARAVWCRLPRPTPRRQTRWARPENSVRVC